MRSALTWAQGLAQGEGLIGGGFGAEAAVGSGVSSGDGHGRFRKPSAPPVLSCALGLWAGCAAAYSLGAAPDAPPAALAALGGVLAAVLTAVLWRRGAKLLLCAALGCALGVCLGAAGAAALHAAQGASASEPRQTWELDLLEDASEGSFSNRAMARARPMQGEDASYRVELSFPKEEGALLYGTRVVCELTLSETPEASADYAWQRGASCKAVASSLQVEPRQDAFGALLDVRARAIELFSQAGEPGALLQALVCGYRPGISGSALYNDFKTTGLAHVVAVSGAHLSIVCGMVASFLNAIRVPRAISVALQGAFIIAYLVFAAAPVSAVRAAVMSSVGLLSYTFRRRKASMNAVGACVVVLLAIDPTTAVSVSFFLSAASTLGIVALSPLFSRWVCSACPRVPQGVSDALSLTAAASVVTLPYSASLFSQLPLVSPLSNMVAAPLFTLACTVGLAAAAAALAMPAFAAAALAASSACSWALASAVSLLARMPYACVPVSLPQMPALLASISLALALWRFWPTPSRKTMGAALFLCAAAFAALAFLAPRLSGSEVIMLDVGQGDAFLVRSGPASVLIDTGNQDALLIEALARHGVMSLDAVVISHGDDDHCGSLDALRGVVRVGKVLVCSDALSCPCNSCETLVSQAEKLVGEGGVAGLSVGDALRVGAFSLRVLAPDGFEEEGGNADSMCLLATEDADGDGVGDWSLLFCGDAEAPELSKLVQGGALGKVDVYKVGHHGSKAALTDEVARALSPRVALVSAGANNRYGHPAKETLDRLVAVGAEVFRTDEQGDVSCRFSKSGLRVTCLR